jgi:hypothetical protein
MQSSRKTRAKFETQDLLRLLGSSGAMLTTDEVVELVALKTRRTSRDISAQVIQMLLHLADSEKVEFLTYGSFRKALWWVPATRSSNSYSNNIKSIERQ